ncbi:AI-2E family transporter [Kitasatospora kifunensis]|uniref:Putative PurR-regulated permease PerM n=1 Tax=Kitasatospora kifunensis TaxID=58351 RepID=A0A7W7R1P9_KITKI|nr:AI-2E family transporter [Kitasatospora kifunensis]MBB4923811.1 putative PurR-regulated permease PerM [Kitasatospora kifunensis]
MARGEKRGGKVARAVAWGASVAAKLAERRRAAIEEQHRASAAEPEPPVTPASQPAPAAEPAPTPRRAPRGEAPYREAPYRDGAYRDAPHREGPYREQQRRAPHPGRPASPADAVPWSLRVAAESTWRLLLLGAALYVVFQVVDMLRLVAFAILAGLLISALLEPTVSWLKRHGVPRVLAAAGTFLMGLAGIGLVGWFVFWQVSTNLPEVSKQATAGVNQLHNWLLKGPMHLTDTQLTDFTNQVKLAITSNTNQITSLGFTTVGIVIQVITGVLLAAFTTYFLLYDGARIWSWLLRGLPRQSRHAMAGAGPKAWATLTAYVRGTVAVAFIDALCIGIGIQLLGVPLAMPLAVIIFLGAFVPLIGAMVTGTLAVLVALVTKDVYTAGMVLVVLVAVQNLEGHLLQPLILGRAVRVHPLGVVLGVASGSIIGGIAGAIVAVPLIAVTNTVISHQRRRNAAADEVFVALEAAQDAAEEAAQEAAYAAQVAPDPSPEQPAAT